MAVTDFKLRYYGSYLGYVWSLLKPLALFSVLYVVFSCFMRWDVEHYQLHLLLGIILWTFFAECTTLGMMALPNRAGVIKKVRFPRIIVVLASSLSALLGFGFNLAVYLIFSLCSGIVPLDGYLPLFLVYMVLLYFLILGISLLLASLYLRFRDINQVWEVALQVGFWLTPIIYPIRMVPEAYRDYLRLNPMTGIIDFSRKALIEGRGPDLPELAALAGASLVLFVAGLLVFGRMEKRAPETL